MKAFLFAYMVVVAIAYACFREMGRSNDRLSALRDSLATASAPLNVTLYGAPDTTRAFRLSWVSHPDSAFFNVEPVRDTIILLYRESDSTLRVARVK